MKSYLQSLWRWPSYLAVSALTFAPLAVAQDTDEEEEEEIFELSPFNVEASEDSGYLGTASLAGTRIKSDLRDIATTVQVITKEFLEDTGATDINELFVYTTGTETGGDQGNFTGTSFNDRTSGVADAAQRGNPQGNTRVRGLGAPDSTRGFFLTSIRSDSYNTQRFEINRGANSILFGLGSPAGVVNVGLVQPLFGKDQTKIKTRNGQFGSWRASIDHNVELIDDKLAFRFAGLATDDRYRQKPTFKRDKRLYASMAWRVDDRTTLRMNGEAGFSEANRPSVIGPGDWVSGWLLAGKPIHDMRWDVNVSAEQFYTDNQAMLDAMGIGPENLGTAKGYNRSRRNLDASTLYGLDSTPYRGVPGGVNNAYNPDDPESTEPERLPGRVVLDLGMGTVLDSFDTSNGPRINSPGFFAYGTVAVFNSANAATPDLGIANMNQNMWPRNGTFIDENGLLPWVDDLTARFPWITGYRDYRVRDAAGARWMYENPSAFTQEQGFLNTDTFDWVNNLLGGSTADQNEDFRTFNVALDRLFLADRSLGVELAYDRQNYERNYFVPFQDRFGGITIDTNPVLPYTSEGFLMENPNFLRPFIFTRYNRRNFTESDRETLRATVFYEFDFGKKMDDSWMRWLGRYVFTGLANSSSRESTNYQEQLHHSDPFFALFGNEPLSSSGAFNTLTNHRIYIGPRVDPGISSLAELDVQAVGPDLRLWDLQSDYTYTVWNPGMTSAGRRPNGNNRAQAQNIWDEAGPDGRGNLQQFTEKNAAFVRSANKSLEEIDSFALNVQSYLFNGNVVATFGYREDEVSIQRTLGTDFARDPATNEILVDSVNVEDMVKSTIETQTSMWSVVGYLPKELIDLPFGADLSGHYGVSENFRPEAGRRNHMDVGLPDPGGETTEFGFTLSLFEKKFYARVNWYETSLINQSKGYSSGQTLNIWDQRPNAWISNYWANQIDPEDPPSSDPEDPDFIDPRVFAGADLGLVAAQTLFESMPDKVREIYGFQYFYGDEGEILGVYSEGATGVTDTQDRTARGVEVELVYNPVSNWRIALNIAKQKTTQTNVGPGARLLVEQVQQSLDTPIPGYGGLTIGELPSWSFWGWDPTRTGTARFTRFEDSSQPETLQEWHNVNGYAKINTSLASEGTQSLHQRPWRVNFLTNYTFRGGRLNSLGVGMGYRWQASASVGYPLITAPDGTYVGDITRPFKNEEQSNWDFWVRYNVPLLKEHGVNWTMQLNVRNAFSSSDDFIPVSYHPGGVLEGKVSRVRYAPPRTIFLTNTFRF